MRVFIGIKISDGFKKEAVGIMENNKNLGLRFIKPKNLHITLVPPWEEKNVERIKRKLEKIDFNPFWISFSNIYLNDRNRVIWIEAEQTSKDLIKLRKELFSELGLEEEKRPFRPHLTIARYGKEIAKDEFKEIVSAFHFKEEVVKITLFKSELGPNEANYFELN